MELLHTEFMYVKTFSRLKESGLENCSTTYVRLTICIYLSCRSKICLQTIYVHIRSSILRSIDIFLNSFKKILFWKYVVALSWIIYTSQRDYPLPGWVWTWEGMRYRQHDVAATNVVPRIVEKLLIFVGGSLERDTAGASRKENNWICQETFFLLLYSLGTLRNW